MTLNRWDPLRDLLNMQERMNRLIGSSLEEKSYNRAACWCPVVDILETADTYVFRAELPGVGRDNITIEVRGNRLILAGERPFESEPTLAAYLSIERVHGCFERSFPLPGRIDLEKAEAHYEDGILEVVLPKSEDQLEPQIRVVCVS
ncbi:MAG TPA: Hsp20/alpha crystallin family protein [Desulfomonilaceae bacterium]|nr:Hsp20/alpha crystallin family protein [Desulfomonilaceae bacterium]